MSSPSLELLFCCVQYSISMTFIASNAYCTPMKTRHKPDQNATNRQSQPETAPNPAPYHIKSQRRGMRTKLLDAHHCAGTLPRAARDVGEALVKRVGADG
jgi:hypothetical protein